MAFLYDTKTGKITCPQGDTGALRVTITGDVSFAPGDMLVFGLQNQSTRKTILRKQVPIEDGMAIIRFSNADTRALDVGSYKYNLRIVTSPEWDASGNVICANDTDNVFTVFNDMPKLEILEVGVNV